VTSPVHVLVADDEPHIGRIIKMKLEQGPFRVTLAYDGREAFEHLERFATIVRQGPFRVTLAYDGREALEVLEREADIGLVLLDLMMPHLTGLDVLAAMREDARWKTLPTIILTAAGQEQQHQRALELGASEFLTKPFSPKKLYQRAAELAGLAPLDAGADGE